MWIGLAYAEHILSDRTHLRANIWLARCGLIHFAPEFQTYWMSILLDRDPLELVSGLGLAGYLWKTRDRNIDAVTPREEMRRIVTLGQWLVVYRVAIYWGASFFTEQDGTWHMTVIRDTDFTPSHIIEFYMSYPIYSVIAVGAFFYARTRIPYFAHGYSLAFLIVAIGPFMIIPNVGLNEWGHTFWFMEELFRCSASLGLRVLRLDGSWRVRRCSSDPRPRSRARWQRRLSPADPVNDLSLPASSKMRAVF